MMDLKIIQPKTNLRRIFFFLIDYLDKGVLAALTWSTNNELYSCGDDKEIKKWNDNGDFLNKVSEVDTYITCIDWFTSLNKLRGVSEMFVIGCADGTFKLVSETGRIEKSVKANQGAIICIKWTYEGTALCTGGEDGSLMLWSRGGSLRSKIANVGKSIYSLAFNNTSEKVLYCFGKELVIKKLHSTSRQRQWKAHDKIVLNVDWSPLTNLLVSSGEEGYYKIWDKFGRVLYKSTFYDHTITSLAWSPCGDFLAVGSYNLIKVCDQNGFCIKRRDFERLGSPFCIAWTRDGTEFAAGGGAGAVVFGKLLRQTVEWNEYHVSMKDVRKLVVTNIMNDNVDDLDFRDKIVKVSISFGHLIVVTSSQCVIYSVQALNSPHAFSIKNSINLIVQANKVFLLADQFSGINVYSYEGRHISSPKIANLKTEFLTRSKVSLCNDTLAIIDQSLKRKSKEIRLFNVSTGKEMGKSIRHNMKVKEISLSQFAGSTTKRASSRHIVFVDRNRDLYISTISLTQDLGVYKLATMVDSVCWNDATDMLVAISDSKLICWTYPNIIYVDRDLLELTKSTKDSSFGKRSRILSFLGSKVRIKMWKGCVLSETVTPYPLFLYNLVGKKKFKEAIRLCRFVKSRSLWAVLAAMSIKSGELNTAEVALAAIEQVDKLKLILQIKQLRSPEARKAELALYQRRPEEAESILLQSDLVYRAVKMNIRLYRWERALTLARKYKAHLETVVYYRRKYNAVFTNGEETNQLFLEFKDTKIDEKKIKDLIKKEKEKEGQRQGAGRV